MGATGAGFSSSQSCPAGHITPVFRFFVFVCIFVSLKFVYLCFMNQPLTSHASGLDGCQAVCTRTRPDLLLFLFLGSQLSLTRISRPAYFHLLFLNIVALIVTVSFVVPCQTENPSLLSQLSQH